ncbi:protein EMBRYO DEFECTIVE 514-like [Vicia villosa]|uniref:protein EMBRYO DEFECTIVE 514-like n=1 Tax=Vicia villosa TaxID=3911 RepID=UPI00273CB9EB|nr:protein EMBRYO DEFECTIVE 514-like [Vicia villosa]
MAETASPEPEIVADETIQKRGREDDLKTVSKKQKVDAEEEKKPSGPVKLGNKTFGSSLELFDYFNTFLHAWGLNLDVNKYEHTMLLELLRKGHPEPNEKIAGEISAFQVRKHPTWKSKCFFLIRGDESADDFSFRKCVDHILPLPEAMQVKHDANRALGKRGGGGKGRGGKGKVKT